MSRPVLPGASLGLATALIATLVALPSGAGAAPTSLPEFPEPVDPQSWTLPAWMTWEDYRPIPGIDWTDPAEAPPRKIRAALILGDFADRDFIVTMPEGSDVFGLDGVHNPIGLGSIPREEVADFYNRFLITEPSELNHFHTVDEYWLEDSYGLVGVEGTAFGPYRMEFKEHEYGFGDAGGGLEACPEGDSCGQDFDTEVIQASLADVTAGIVTNGGEDYDFRWLLHAGYDESGTWQEFGEMLFADRNDVSEELGNPDPSKPNWASTRYIEWTSFAAAEGIWSHAVPGVTSTQGENDGASVFAHELSHIFGVLDNYNNPYGDPVRRAYSGPWDMLSRGTFNGPGGAHNRWQIPPTLGGTMGSHHMLRNKIRLGFMKPNEVMVLQRDALQLTGPQFADIYPRAYPLAPVTGDTGLHGVQIVLPQDRAPACTIAEDHTCDGRGYQNYTIEVVDRIGYDSFTPDHGVLLAKTKNVDTSPFIWVVDAHPEDINDVTAPPPNDDIDIYDYDEPGTGNKRRISLGDYRQLADALLHAGTGAGVVHEYVDEPNGLHFYVLATNVDDRGVRTYRVAVRSLAGGGPFPRGVEAAEGAAGEAPAGEVAVVTCPITNSGTGVDLIRLAGDAGGWTTQLSHEVVELAAGATLEVPLYVAVPSDGTGTRQVSVNATSETDPDATATCTANVTARPARAPSETPTSSEQPTGGGTPTATPGTPTATSTTSPGATASPSATTRPPGPGGQLPTTGGGALAGLGALGVIATLLARRRRTPRWARGG